jgi:hypothetical protein
MQLCTQTTILLNHLGRSNPTFPNTLSNLRRPKHTLQNAFPGEALFNLVSPKYCTHTLEKCFPGKRILKCWFVLPNFGIHATFAFVVDAASYRQAYQSPIVDRVTPPRPVSSSASLFNVGDGLNKS